MTKNQVKLEQNTVCIRQIIQETMISTIVSCKHREYKVGWFTHPSKISSEREIIGTIFTRIVWYRHVHRIITHAAACNWLYPYITWLLILDCSCKVKAAMGSPKSWHSISWTSSSSWPNDMKDLSNNNSYCQTVVCCWRGSTDLAEEGSA
jgi:hypothetical protein